MKLMKFYFENGVFVGYYIQDSRGVNWSVETTAEKAYENFKRLTVWDRV